MGKNTTKQDKAKRNLEFARAHRKPTRPAGRFGRPKFNRPAEVPAGAPASQGVGSVHETEPKRTSE